ncbi:MULTISPECIES: LTA synthase family protein [unclassified Paenibacillus]|uniref:LTA synthase family protein n=1 Tax=unclassified Paenibacillus TaxID=185978 RepID=UPI00240527E5|nr:MULTISPECIES: LTA synthase family protein [unclassified Paenibacillus]MDF9841509.1 lipoteichoic acid synthase [Paenibacillus sp. PastF-2]MDF9848098.1 lipoteichoic acid synthase [Paenibacillus sp. PastM-2]MDF9854667.1 lipoteichoic acid synthase [Paenibacillus sp. PastF-1]MDH6479725.1 lipoteichoic acid synthase [Paenibacillus sp. PastH-2]MDH6507373.1 lipoteichoic acid synthase [Paenibacillus sp. PastM-3]
MRLKEPRTLSKRSILFFSIIMLAKSYFAWYYLFEDGPTWSTWFKEIPFVLIIFCLIEWFATKRKIAIYMLVNLLITVLFFSLIVYHNHFGIIATSQVIGQAKQVGAVKKSIFAVIHPQYMLIFLDIIIISLIMLSRKKALAWKKAMSRRSNRKVVAALFCISLVICMMNIFPNKASMNETVQAEQMGILNYEAYALLAGQEEELIDSSAITQSVIDQTKGITAKSTPILYGAAKGKNLVIIQMESFQNFLIHLSIDGQEITPNMNKLADSSIYFPRFFQQVGQGNTSDAEFIVNTSFYVPPDGPATEIYAPKELPSLPKLLQEQGYDTATFHTNEVDFWNRGELYRALGFNRYYDKAFFGEDDTVFYGASDEVLYSKTSAELARMNESSQPFYSHVISMSSHNPFTIPQNKYQMILPERYEGTFVGDYIRAQNYADYALGQFIAELKENGVWDDSLVVLYGDHRGLPIFSLKDEDKVLLEEILGKEYTERDLINIPLIISSAGVPVPSVQNQLGGQVDILPTVANLLGVPLDNHIHFGQDILNQREYNLLPQRYYLPTGSFVNNEELFLSGSGFEDGQHYTLSGDGDKPLQSTEDEFNSALKLLQLSDSYVSQLPDREVAEE